MSSSTDRSAGTLYLVPTPLGNLADITLRAMETLSSCDVIAAEDTRHTRGLLEHHGIRTRTVSLHRFNEMLRSGRDVACVTDSGTPGVSDPGARLVSRVREAGLAVVPLPGPSAPAAAISASGWEGPFTFEGYVERRPADRRRQIERLARQDRAAVLFESPRRLRATLAAFAEQAPVARILLAREMTKIHEEYRVDTAAGLLATLPERVRGEITLVVMPGPAGPEASPPGLEPAVDAAGELVKLGVRLKHASRIVGTLTGIGAKLIYDEVDRRRR
jgi:16S rRNA (cytidine1402-2'-O)-methyltransferase